LIDDLPADERALHEFAIAPRTATPILR
jgi:hypothetical protein